MLNGCGRGADSDASREDLIAEQLADHYVQAIAETSGLVLEYWLDTAGSALALMQVAAPLLDFYLQVRELSLSYRTDC